MRQASGGDLKSALDANGGFGPGFNIIRHALAVIILLTHCRASVNGLPDAPHIVVASADAGPHLNPFALQSTGNYIVFLLFQPIRLSLVAAFFALSGFLVTASAIRSTKIKTFFANRALRIIPALSVEVTLSAIILGPVVTSLPLSQYFSDYQFFRYFGNIIGEITLYLPGVFESLPWPRVVNGNLWTLPSEFWCYAIVMGIMLAGLIKKPIVILISTLLALFLPAIVNVVAPRTIAFDIFGSHYPDWYVVVMFFVGACYYLYAKYVILDLKLFLACAALYYISVDFSLLPELSGIPLAYCVAFIGMSRFDWFDRLFKADYSYGIYLYGFPITQTLVYFLGDKINLIPQLAKIPTVFLTSLAITTTFAALSWKFFEKPALGLKRYFA